VIRPEFAVTITPHRALHASFIGAAPFLQEWRKKAILGTNMGRPRMIGQPPHWSNSP
jgi:hypothetical protein